MQYVHVQALTVPAELMYFVSIRRYVLRTDIHSEVLHSSSRFGPSLGKTPSKRYDHLGLTPPSSPLIIHHMFHFTRHGSSRSTTSIFSKVPRSCTVVWSNESVLSAWQNTPNSGFFLVSQPEAASTHRILDPLVREFIQPHF